MRDTNMSPVSLSFLLSFCVCWVGAQRLQCYDCHDLRNPNDCYGRRDCGPEDVCAAEYKIGHHQEDIWHISCMKAKDCNRPLHPDQRCVECCRSNMCNKQLCAHYQPTVSTKKTTSTSTSTTSTSTTTTSTKATTQVHHDFHHPYMCIDLETNTVNCTDLKVHGHCLHVPSTLYETAKLRCRKTCGFC